jgi:hypothetical protein
LTLFLISCIMSTKESWLFYCHCAGSSIYQSSQILQQPSNWSLSPISNVSNLFHLWLPE